MLCYNVNLRGPANTEKERKKKGGWCPHTVWGHQLCGGMYIVKSTEDQDFILDRGAKMSRLVAGSGAKQHAAVITLH